MQIGRGSASLEGAGVREPLHAQGAGVDPRDYERAVTFPALGALARVGLLYVSHHHHQDTSVRSV